MLKEIRNNSSRCSKLFSIIFFAAIWFGQLLRPTHDTARNDSISQSSRRLSPTLGLSVAMAVAAISYIRTLPLFFICDDFGHLDLIRHSFVVAIWPQFTKGQVGTFYRPLGFVSLFLDFRLWHVWAPGYHLTNIALHLLCVAAIFCFCRQTGFRTEICFAASLFFAVMPVNAQVVSWMSCRFDLLATALGMWSVVFAARYRESGESKAYLVAILLFVLAALSKESAYVVPVYWLALELLPKGKFTFSPSLRRRAAALLGYLGAPALLLLHRFCVIGGVGGYIPDHPLALSFHMPSLIGLLSRAPGETLFGYNWLQPEHRLWLYSTILTASIFLALSFRMKMDLGLRARISFLLIWTYISALPGHFFFRVPDPGLLGSRGLYFGAIGVAVLIAILLNETLPHPRVFLSSAAVIALLMFCGLQHNISAWRDAVEDSQKWHMAFKRTYPSPPANVAYQITGVPMQVDGVPFFAAALDHAIRFDYGWREDIRVESGDDLKIDPNAVLIQYAKVEPQRHPSRDVTIQTGE
jgi:hypothetical protein